MDVLTERLSDSIQYDFDAARLDFLAARRQQQTKDTPAARRRVAECQEQVDRILDMWNDALLISG
jgi:hypothetical protein